MFNFVIKDVQYVQYILEATIVKILEMYTIILYLRNSLIILL